MPKQPAIGGFTLVEISPEFAATYSRRFLAIVKGQGVNEGEPPTYFTFEGGANLYDVFDKIKERRSTPPEPQVRTPPVPADQPGDPGPLSITEGERFRMTGFQDPEA